MISQKKLEKQVWSPTVSDIDLSSFIVSDCWFSVDRVIPSSEIFKWSISKGLSFVLYEIDISICTCDDICSLSSDGYTSVDDWCSTVF